MEHTSSVQKTMNNEFFAVLLQSFPGKGDHKALEISSIQSLKKSESLVSMVTAPFRFIMGLINRITSFFCRYVCGCSGISEKINWAQTREIFADVYTQVCTSEENPTTRKKAFDQLMSKLSKDARDRFKDHLAYAYAASIGKKERAEQEEWALKNFKKVPFDDFFANINSDVLKAATRSFQIEIAQNLY